MKSSYIKLHSDVRSTKRLACQERKSTMVRFNSYWALYDCLKVNVIILFGSMSKLSKCVKLSSIEIKKKFSSCIDIPLFLYCFLIYSVVVRFNYQLLQLRWNNSNYFVDNWEWYCIIRSIYLDIFSYNHNIVKNSTSNLLNYMF